MTYLILGDTPQLKLRVVFVRHGTTQGPPELKFLHLSWHEVISDIDAYYANLAARQTRGDRILWREEIPRRYNGTCAPQWLGNSCAG